MQDGGCLVSTCINAACLALLDASVPLSFLLAAVTVAVTEDGELLVDPTLKQARPFWPKSSESVEDFFDTGKELQSRGNVCLLLTRRRSCVQCCRGQTRTWPASTSLDSCQACLQGHLWVLQGDHPEKVFQGSLVSRFFHDFQRCQEWGRVTIPTTSLWRTSWPLRSGSLWRWKGKLLHLKSASFLRITAWLSIDKFPNRWERICQTLDFLTLGRTTRSLREALSEKDNCFLLLKAILKSQAGTSPVDGWRSEVR